MSASNATVGPLLGDRVGTIDPAPSKPRGSIISCPNDHWLYRLMVDLERGMVMKAAHVENIEDTMPMPAPMTKIQLTCSVCGEPWRRLVDCSYVMGFPVDPRWQTHFTTGWWPAIEDK